MSQTNRRARIFPADSDDPVANQHYGERCRILRTVKVASGNTHVKVELDDGSQSWFRKTDVEPEL